MLCLLFLGVSLAIGGANYLANPSAADVASSPSETARITFIGVGGSKYQVAPSRVVHAQDDAGLVGSKLVQPNEIFGCQVGDKIKAQRSGTTLILAPAPCR